MRKRCRASMLYVLRQMADIALNHYPPARPPKKFAICYVWFYCVCEVGDKVLGLGEL